MFMTLAEYYANCELKQKEMLKAKEDAEKEAERLEIERNTPAKTLRNRRKRNKAKDKAKEAQVEDSKTWKSVDKVRPEKNQVWARINYPDNWSKDLYIASAPSKITNTTLILKNLPYEGVTERDIKRFFYFFYFLFH